MLFPRPIRRSTGRRGECSSSGADQQAELALLEFVAAFGDLAVEEAGGVVPVK
jgi:hypothetical protein